MYAGSIGRYESGKVVVVDTGTVDVVVEDVVVVGGTVDVVDVDVVVVDVVVVDVVDTTVVVVELRGGAAPATSELQGSTAEITTNEPNNATMRVAAALTDLCSFAMDLRVEELPPQVKSRRRPA